MIDKYSGLSYDSFEVIEDDLYGNWFNKFQMYDSFRDNEKVYFNLDVVIFNKLANLIKKKFTLLDDTWWREPAHTPLNSSIVSWTGDVSHIWKKFRENDKLYLQKYNKGSDEFYFKEIQYQTYSKMCPSIKNYIYEKPKDYSIVTLGQMHHILEKGWTGWWSDYLIKSNAHSSA